MGGNSGLEVGERVVVGDRIGIQIVEVFYIVHPLAFENIDICDGLA